MINAHSINNPTLNILLVLNNEFLHAAERVFNPANAMIISKNDGLFDNNYNNQRDTLINANTLINLSRKYYTKEEIAEIRSLQAMRPD